MRISEWKQFVDFMPLLSISESKIKSIQQHNIYEIRNRVYWFSKYFAVSCQIKTNINYQVPKSNEIFFLQCDAHIVSHYCVKHLFIFKMDSELLSRKINLVEINLSPENILRDLDIFARAEDTIKARIEYLQICGVGHILPWMIKCDHRLLDR